MPGMSRLVRPTLAALALIAPFVGCTALTLRPSGERAGANVGLDDGARSVDELLQDFVVAVHENNSEELRRLRVTEQEYRKVILPGSVAPGEEPRKFNSDLEDYLWGSLDVKNRHGEHDLLEQWGGRAFVVEKASFQRGVRPYRGYTAHSRLLLTVRDDHGAQVDFQMGSVAQVGDRYKFISFIRD
jgi:hypothetical protein